MEQNLQEGHQMPITLTVAEKMRVIENRCKQTMSMKLDNEIIRDSYLEVPEGERSDIAKATLDQIDKVITEQEGQIAYYQAQYEALEDVAVDDGPGAPAATNEVAEARAVRQAGQNETKRGVKKVGAKT